MKLVLVVITVVCGAALLFGIPTGSLTGMELAGVGLISAGLAEVAP